MSTAVQTSYGFGFPKGVAGGLFDLSAHDVTTRQAEGDGVAFGLGVVVGTNKGTDVKLPATGATSDDFEGVVVHNSVMVEKDMDNNKSWNDNWATLSTYFKYPEAVRRLIYTTNAIEGFNRQLRKVTKSKTVFPSDDSFLKML